MYTITVKLYLKLNCVMKMLCFRYKVPQIDNNNMYTMLSQMRRVRHEQRTSYIVSLRQQCQLILAAVLLIEKKTKLLDKQNIEQI